MHKLQSYECVEPYVTDSMIQKTFKQSKNLNYYKELVKKRLEQDAAIENKTADKFGELLCYKCYPN